MKFRPDIDNVWMHLAWMLPRRLVYWCAVRVGVHGTKGLYAKQIVPELYFMDALMRWDDPATHEKKKEI